MAHDESRHRTHRRILRSKHQHQGSRAGLLRWRDFGDRLCTGWRWNRGSGFACYAYHLGMNLAVNPPVLPMLSKRIAELPAAGDWIFEPKWDGFRALIFRDGDEILIQSRDAKPLNRYFPELLHPIRAQLPERCVLDGEIVIAHGGRLDFDALQLRLHPAASRVQLLAAQSPASIVFFDVLCVGDRDLRDAAF